MVIKRWRKLRNFQELSGFSGHTGCDNTIQKIKQGTTAGVIIKMIP